MNIRQYARRTGLVRDKAELESDSTTLVRDSNRRVTDRTAALVVLLLAGSSARTSCFVGRIDASVSIPSGSPMDGVAQAGALTWLSVSAISTSLARDSQRETRDR